MQLQEQLCQIVFQNAQLLYDDIFTALPVYSINFSFACLVAWGFSARHVHNSIYFSFKYEDLAICVCIELICLKGY